MVKLKKNYQVCGKNKLKDINSDKTDVPLLDQLTQIRSNSDYIESIKSETNFE